jgi:hypothetical protein
VPKTSCQEQIIVLRTGFDRGEMDRLERELSKLDSGSPTTPQRSHIQNGAVVPGGRSTTNLCRKSQRDGSMKRRPTKFAPGGIELIPQPSSSPSDPLVRSLATESEHLVTDHGYRTGPDLRKNVLSPP